LLYVALTRAREKVLINGHLSEARSNLGAGGWLKALLEKLGVETASFEGRQEQWIHHQLSSGASIAIWVGHGGGEPKRSEERAITWPDSEDKPIYMPLVETRSVQADLGEETEPVRDWRATGEHVHAPAAAIGRMVHEALRRWVSPQDPALEGLLEHLAFEEGLVDQGQRRRAMLESQKLLRRFWDDPLRGRIDRAEERHHELSYTLSLPQGGMDIGTIDLLYRDGDGWTIIDFKTDELRDEEALQKAVEDYRPQLMRYKRAVQDLLNRSNHALICFLDFQNTVEWVAIQ